MEMENGAHQPQLESQRVNIMSTDRVTRRSFVETVGFTAGAGAASLLAAPAIARGGQGANEKIRLGLIGAGSRGNQLLDSFLKQADIEIIAIADVDDKHTDETVERIKKEKGNSPQGARDYRPMLDRKDLDGVIIATPDHWHALPAIQAVLAGKDVYVEKPVAHNVAEGQAMLRARHEKRARLGMAVGTQQPLVVAFPEGGGNRSPGQARQDLLGPNLELRKHQPRGHGKDS